MSRYNQVQFEFENCMMDEGYLDRLYCTLKLSLSAIEEPSPNFPSRFLVRSTHNMLEDQK